MVQYTNRKCVIKNSRKRQAVNIRLHHVRVGHVTSRSVCGFNCVAQIDADNILHPPAGSQLGMPPLATTTFQHNLPGKKLRLDRRNPAKKLFRITFISLSEVSPLPAKLCCCVRFVCCELIKPGKPRNTAQDRKAVRAITADQFPLNDLCSVLLFCEERERSATFGALKILQQGWFHKSEGQPVSVYSLSLSLWSVPLSASGEGLGERLVGVYNPTPIPSPLVGRG